MTEHRAGPKPQRGGKAKAFRRDALPSGQDHAHRQRQVEKDMRKNDAMKTIDGYRRKSHRLQRAIQQALAAENGQQPQNGRDHRQKERRAHQRNQHLPPGKATPRQGPRHWDSKAHGQQRRNRCLKHGKPYRGPVGSGQRSFISPRQHRPQGAQRQQAKGGGNRHPGPDQRASAARHASNAPGRSFAASSADSSRDVSGTISVSNPSGSPEAGVTAGYIQFVVGISD